MTAKSIALSIVLSTMTSLSIASNKLSSVQPQAKADNMVVVSIGADVMKEMSVAKKKSLSVVSLDAATKDNTNDVRIIKLPSNQIEALSAYVHKTHHRCGGFIWHESEEAALKYTKNLKALQPKALVEYTIDNEETTEVLLNKVVASNLTETVQNMGAYNNRYYTQDSGVQASEWLKSHWESIADGREDISVELYQHSNWIQPSVIVTIPGTDLADEVVVVGGHLDSINQSNPSTGRAPGYDDNASGIAVVTETLRAIVQSGYQPQRTVKLMGYAAEEVGLRGSGDIASDYLSNGVDVVGVAQFDMSGYKGTADKDIVFITDFTNAAQNQFMKDLMDHYFPELEYGDSVCGYGCSDHASWHNRGIPASFPFESEFDDYNRDIHSTVDNHFEPNHSVNFLRLSIAYVSELAKGTEGAFDYQSRSTIEFSEASQSINEGQSISVLVTRSGMLDESAQVNYRTVDGTAVGGEDYESASGILQWPANDSTVRNIRISSLNLNEDKEFTIELYEVGGNGELGEKSTLAVRMINESVSTVEFEVSELTLDESSSRTIVIKRLGDFDQEARVSYQAVNGTAIAGTDYQAVSGSLRWEAGDQADKTIEVTTFAVNSDKTFTIDLRNVGGNAVIGDVAEVAVSIIDKDSPEPEEPDNNNGGNSGGGVLFIVSLLLLTVGLRRRRR
ncbi:M20/M25/M40 family metallo-hydrolase [Pleionea sediminis]|uniref:M20/M25/M40 family metallo-hydrolase n=1 Tax=Pleionea sediminis TaxID=2569479 RepID=UPI00118532EF|nr:M20/M25/M40 family metallo-hydrolase [Pleionea sediminis]